MSDGSQGDGFFGRWSRRKRDAAEAPARPEDARAPGEEAGLSEAERRRIVEELPDVETLTADSDFTAFMREGVPAELRERALRRLWRLNPVFANLDGLNDYDLDYTDAATVVENLKSAWRAGKGYADERTEEGGGRRAGDSADRDGGEAAAEARAGDESEAPGAADAAGPSSAPPGAPDDAGTGRDDGGEQEAATARREAAGTERQEHGGPPGRAARRRWGNSKA